MSGNIYRNPFIECTARDMNYNEVLHFWCNSFELYRLDKYALLSIHTPYMLEGARGSGKTMILKYLSYHCQKMIANTDGQTDLFKYFHELGSLGVYYRYKEDLTHNIELLPFSEESKCEIFQYYYELLISREIVTILMDLSECEFSGKYMDKDTLLSDFNAIYKTSIHSPSEMLNAINSKLDAIDVWNKKCRYNSNAENDFREMCMSNLIRKTIAALRRNIPILSGVKIMIILDEYENIGKWQKITNTFIKQIDNSEGITYRIGLRPEGIKDYKTLIGNEVLQESRDFILSRLTASSRQKWNGFLKAVANKRLRMCMYGENVNITDFLGKKENYEAEALQSISNSRYEHFKILRSLTGSQIDLLKCDDRPIIEMLNIMWVVRGKSPKETKEAMDKYLSMEESGPSKYKRDYTDKYKYQLLLTLLNYNSMTKKYYSFNTFSFLSNGCVNDFISLCRNTFDLLDESYYKNMPANKEIPLRLQTKGAYNTAVELLNNIKINNENGLYMHTFIMNLGNLLETFNKVQIVGRGNVSFAKYPETTQFIFNDEAEILDDDNTSDIIRSLIKWSGVIRNHKLQRPTLSRQGKGTIYRINPIFAPLFNLSYRTRGGYNHPISKDEFVSMFSTNNSRKVSKSDMEGQLSLF